MTWWMTLITKNSQYPLRAGACQIKRDLGPPVEARLRQWPPSNSLLRIAAAPP